jgi:hypothetical protein
MVMGAGEWPSSRASMPMGRSDSLAAIRSILKVFGYRWASLSIANSATSRSSAFSGNVTRSSATVMAVRRRGPEQRLCAHHLTVMALCQQPLKSATFKYFPALSTYLAVLITTMRDLVRTLTPTAGGARYARSPVRRDRGRHCALAAVLSPGHSVVGEPGLSRAGRGHHGRPARPGRKARMLGG